MTQDEIIEMYLEVSNKLCNGTEWCWAGVGEPLQLFAKLVAEHEREACAKVCEDAPEPDGADLAERIRARGEAFEATTAIKAALEAKDEPFKPDYNTEAVLVEEMQRMAKRIEDLETGQDCVGWFGYDTGLRLWFETNKGDDGAIPLYKARSET